MGRLDFGKIAAEIERLEARLLEGLPDDALIKVAARARAETLGYAKALEQLIIAQSARLDALEAKLATLETRGLEYRGVHQRAESYRRGDAVTHKGGIWVAVRDDARDIPGQGDSWQLAVKGAAQ